MSGFRHLGDQLVHQGYVWHVSVASFESPDGVAFTRDIVRSPGAVAAVPLVVRSDGTLEVVFVRQYRPPYDQYVLEIPAGMRDVPGEEPAATADRELAEEVGLAAGSLVPLTQFYPSPGMTDSVLHLYLATDLTEVDREAHGPEEQHMDVVTIALDEAVAMVERGEICDAKTVIGLLLVARRHERGEL